MNQLPKRAEDIFLAALDQSTAQERSAYVESACAGIPDLLERVKELLASHEKSGGPLDSPPEGITLFASTVQEQVGTVVGPYRLLEQIGEGGMGAVFRAAQSAPVARTVALKIIKPGMDTKQVVIRFEAERQTLALMDHPHIAMVLDAGVADSGRPYFVMEMVDGTPITDYCDENRLSIDERLALFIKVCRAVQHAHQKGVIHRDLKPTNILVAVHDGVPVPKVIDFGVAKAITQGLTERTIFTDFAQLVGTPLYMSPEQAELKRFDIDTRSDVYSLGVLLYELICGSTPFDRETLKQAGFDEMRRMIREDEPPRPSVRLSSMQPAALTTVSRQRCSDPRRLCGTLRGELDWIIMRALEKDRDRRYESASAFADDVQRHLQDLPIQASPPSRGYALRKFVRRHQTILATAALVLAIVITGAAISVWQAREAYIARKSAEHNLGVAQRQQFETETQRQSANRLAVNLAFDRGIMRCQQGEVAEGVLWLARALEASQSTGAESEWAIRTNLQYWRRQLLTLKSISQVAEGPTLVSADIDGETLRVVAADDATTRVWDLATGQVFGQPFETPDETLAVAFVGPERDRLLIGDLEGKVTLWDYQAGQAEILSRSSKRRITTVAASSDGTLALVCDYQGTAQLWDLARGNPLGAGVPIGLGQGSAFSPDGKTVLFCQDDALHYADVTATPLAWQSLKTDGLQVLAAAISFDGTKLLHGSASQAVLRSTVDNAIIGVPMQHRGHVSAVAFDRQGKYLLTGGHDRRTRLWNATTQQPVGQSLEHEGRLVAVDFCADRDTFISVSDGGIARQWEMPQEAPPPPVLPHAFQPLGACFHPQGQRLATAAWEDNDHSVIRIWDLANGELLRTMPTEGYVRCLAFHPEGKLLAVGASAVLTLWQPGNETKPLVTRLALPANATALGFTSSGDVLFVGMSGGLLRLSGKTLETAAPPLRQPGQVSSIAVSPNGNSLLVGGSAGSVRLWNIATGSPLWETETRRSGVLAATFSPDGQELLVTHSDGAVFRYDAENGERLGELLSMHRQHRAISFSSDGRTALAIGADANAQLLDLATGRVLGDTFEFHGPIHSAVFSPDGRWITVIAPDHSIRLRAVPRPISGYAAGITRWVQAATGMQLDHDNVIQLLTPEEWMHRKGELEQYGGAPSLEHSMIERQRDAAASHIIR